MENNNTEQTSNVQKRPVKAGVLIMLAFGLIIVILSMAGYMPSDDSGKMVTRGGVELTVQVVATDYPEALPVIDRAVVLIDAAVDARQGNPAPLVASLRKTATSYDLPYEIRSAGAIIIPMVIASVNEAFKSSETEEEYISRLREISEYFKEALNNCPESIDTTVVK